MGERFWFERFSKKLGVAGNGLLVNAQIHNF